MRFCFKVLDTKNVEFIDESDLFFIMKTCKKPSILKQEKDMYLEVFSDDFIQITKFINLKRRIKGKDDQI